MRFRRLLAGALATIALGGVVAEVAPAVAHNLRPKGAKVDPELTTQLAAAKPGDKLMVFVHGSSARAAVEAARTSGLEVLSTWRQIGVAVAVGSPSAINRVSKVDGLSYLEANRELQYQLDSSHRATRYAEARHGFDYVVTIPGKKVKRKVTITERRRVKRNGKWTTVRQRRRVTRTVQLPDTFETRRTPPADGSGIGIAIVDSGVDGTHPMFKLPDGTSKVVRNLKLTCASGVLVATSGPCERDPRASGFGDSWDDTFVDVSDNNSDNKSAGGHGTHVAAIAGGNDVTTTDGKKASGAAPGSRLVALSVGATLSVYGGNAGLNWVLEHHAAPCGAKVPAAKCPPIRVVNNSYGGPTEYDSNSASAKIQDALVKAGVVVVWAAGNGDEVTGGGDGSDNRTNSDGSSPTPGVLSVANYDDGGSGSREGSLNPSSSRGQNGRWRTYPDISAPGTDILAACRPDLPICSSGTGTNDPNYGTISGTSMAAPHIAGYAAGMLQANPSLTPAQVEDILEDTAHPFRFGAPYQRDPRNPDGVTSFDKGHGLVDMVRALARAYAVPAGARLPVAAATSSCGSDGTVATDAAGDYSTPELDVLAGRMSYNAGTRELTFVTKVRDLTPGYPTGVTGLQYAFNFASGGRQYYVSASRRMVAGTPPQPNRESFGLGRTVDRQQSTLGSTGMRGKFDFDRDEVTVVLTQAAVDEANKTLAAEKAPLIPNLDGGVTFNGLGLTSEEIQAVLVTPGDSATSACVFVLAGGAQPIPAQPLAADPDPPAAAAEPPSVATLSVGSPDYKWTSKKYTNVVLPVEDGPCAEPANAACDRRSVKLVVPAGGALLNVTLKAALSPVTDFDLYVYGPDGNVVVQSANPGSEEGVSIDIQRSGVYVIAVSAYATVETSYDGVARLTPL